jgi:hypothetical protein
MLPPSSFSRADDGWLEVAKLSPPAGEGLRFGQSVAIDGNTVLAGAPYDAQAGQDAGAAYVLRFYDGEVPASEGVGLALLLSAVLGTGAWFLSRPR